MLLNQKRNEFKIRIKYLVDIIKKRYNIINKDYIKENKMNEKTEKTLNTEETMVDIKIDTNSENEDTKITNSEENIIDANFTTKSEEYNKVQQPQPRLSKKEIRSLKDSKYNESISKYNTSYVLLNNKTGMIVEMKAASPVHACKMIGWRIKNCSLLDTIIDKK